MAVVVVVVGEDRNMGLRQDKKKFIILNCERRAAAAAAAAVKLYYLQIWKLPTMHNIIYWVGYDFYAGTLCVSSSFIWSSNADDDDDDGGDGVDDNFASPIVCQYVPPEV